MNILNKQALYVAVLLALLISVNTKADNVKSGDVALLFDNDSLTAEQWESARGGAKLITVPVVQQIVNRWSVAPEHVVELQYPGGEEGELWVSELKDWLISLGIPSKYLQTVPGSGRDDLIRFKLIQDGEVFQ